MKIFFKIKNNFESFRKYWAFFAFFKKSTGNWQNLIMKSEIMIRYQIKNKAIQSTSIITIYRQISLTIPFLLKKMKFFTMNPTKKQNFFYSLIDKKQINR